MVHARRYGFVDCRKQMAFNNNEVRSYDHRTIEGPPEG